MDENRLGRLEDGLANYRRALPLLEELTRQDPDSGMWEENEETHASSIAACAGQHTRFAD